MHIFDFAYNYEQQRKSWYYINSDEVSTANEEEGGVYVECILRRSGGSSL